jgi:stage II sporulation protein R
VGPRGRPARLLAAGGALLLAAGLLAGLGPVVVQPGDLGPTLRLRVVAASDQPAAQAAKLAVRDAVVALLAPDLARAPSAAAAERWVRRELPALRRTVAAVAAAHGETAQVALGLEPFPRERLGGLAFPAGRYAALVVRLGAARGRNWWTLLFPPLTFLTVGGRLVVVGPAEGPRDDRPDPAWIARLEGRAIPAGARGTPAARVEVRFLAWTLLQRLGWRAPERWLLAHLVPSRHGTTSGKAAPSTTTTSA